MKIEVTFMSRADETMGHSGKTPHLQVERFHQLLAEGVFGEKVEVTYRRDVIPPGRDGGEPLFIGIEYTVRADDASNEIFLEKVVVE